jgi:hypothetical protein
MHQNVIRPQANANAALDGLAQNAGNDALLAHGAQIANKFAIVQMRQNVIRPRDFVIVPRGGWDEIVNMVNEGGRGAYFYRNLMVNYGGKNAPN